jgi:hypothetical protein
LAWGLFTFVHVTGAAVSLKACSASTGVRIVTVSARTIIQAWERSTLVDIDLAIRACKSDGAGACVEANCFFAITTVCARGCVALSNLCKTITCTHRIGALVANVWNTIVVLVGVVVTPRIVRVAV